MVKETQLLFGRFSIVRLLFRPLAGFGFSNHLPAKAFRGLVALRLFFDDLSDCLVKRLSMGNNVLADGKGRQVEMEYWNNGILE